MSETENQQGDPAAELSADDIFTQRVNKVTELAQSGIKPFGERFDGSQKSADLRAAFRPDDPAPQPACVAGRMTAMRVMGNAIFADVRDSSGHMQLFISKKEIGPDLFKLVKKLDVGDLVGASGDLFVTKTEELTIKVHDFKLLSKSLRPLPEKFHGLTNVEQRYRQRYLDLIMNDDSRRVFQQRFAILKEIRRFLSDEKGFTEVETPMLQPIPGGASANPFKTYYEALSSTMYMRIAPELYLKRLLVGGFEKVFEMNRNFRNEGMDRRHNPEFTMMEIYQAYGDCRTMMDLVEELVTNLATKIIGTLQIKLTNGTVIDLTRPWKRAPYRDLVKAKMGDDWFELSKEAKVAKAKAAGVETDVSMPDFGITNDVYEKLIENTLIQPTFVTRLPAELVPLAKACPDDPSSVDVFELEINGQEVAPGYSELNDPIEQRRRFEEQFERERKEGEVMSDKIDEDFLVALEHGMPPAGGMGIGIDRLVMLLTAAESIRDVVLFPQMRLKKN